MDVAMVTAILVVMVVLAYFLGMSVQRHKTIDRFVDDKSRREAICEFDQMAGRMHERH